MRMAWAAFPHRQHTRNSLDAVTPAVPVDRASGPGCSALRVHVAAVSRFFINLQGANVPASPSPALTSPGICRTRTELPAASPSGR